MVPSKHTNPFYIHLLFSGNLEEEIDKWLKIFDNHMKK
jgi:hypothetical protein